MILLRPVLLATRVGLAGCAEPMLRPPYPEKQAMRRAPPHTRAKVRTVVQSSPAPACPVPIAASEELAGPERQAQSNAVRRANLGPEEKESLFRDFDDYLRRWGGR